MRGRRSASRTLAARVFARDGLKCLRCGTDENLTVDHVVAWSDGGPTTFENLQTLCLSCNVRKGGGVGQWRHVVGHGGLWTGKGSLRDFSAEVEIVDVRSTARHIQVLVEPVSGSGQAWVDVGRVTITGGKA